MDVRKIRNELRMGRSIYDLPLRVTFYARVSTDMDAQLNSLENQIQYYTEFIQSKPNWVFVPGYIDEGISGGSTKKRDDFNRMIRDAKAGFFDFIITKEISRFSRSTLDSIQYTQLLLEQGLIPRKTFDSAANIINSTLDFEEFFWYPVCCKKEGEDHGCS